jgi:hypothetical protein
MEERRKIYKIERRRGFASVFSQGHGRTGIALRLMSADENSRRYPSTWQRRMKSSTGLT